MRVNAADLGKALKKVRHAAEKGDHRDRYARVWIEAGAREKFVRVVAHDNYRLAVAMVDLFDDKAAQTICLLVDANYTALLYFLAACPDDVTFQPPVNEADRVVFWNNDSSMTLRNDPARTDPPDWRKIAGMERSTTMKVNLAHLAEAAAGEDIGYLAVGGPEVAIAYLTERYQEYVMPMRVAERKPEPDRSEFVGAPTGG